MKFTVIHTMRFLTELKAETPEEAFEKAKEVTVTWDDYLDLQDIEVKWESQEGYKNSEVRRING